MAWTMVSYAQSEIFAVCIWNATSETFWPQLQFVTKNIDIWCTWKSEHWICHAFAKTIGKFIFVPPSRTADIFVATKWANPQYSAGIRIYFGTIFFYHFRFLIFADIGCVLADSIFVHFYEDGTTILNIQCGPSLLSWSIHTFFVLVDTYPLVGSKKGMYWPKQKRICIDQDVIDGPHCTFLTLFGTGEYFNHLALFNSICFHQNFSIYF